VQPAKALEPETAADYYEVLKGFHVDVVRRAAKQLATTNTFFPSTAEWYDVAARLVAHDAPPSAVRRMDAQEAREYLRARALHYEDQPCDCVHCQRASVTTRPIRFVPDFDAEDRECKAFHPGLNRDVVTGHWAHGEELARWYRAKEAFYAQGRALGHARVLRLIGGREREPGEEG
jgi:hypothetical protein